MKTVNSTNTVYIYDNWAMIAELTTNSTQQTTNYYVWGLDLSQTLQGAGGVGGLLSQTHHASPDTLHSFPTYDANGNIVDYVSTNGTTVAHYDYGPFGGTIASTGSKKDNFVFRFSTKNLDEETSLYYYGYRYYSPRLGRWPSRDPIGEEGGRNLYVFLQNEPISQTDYLGLLSKCECYLLHSLNSKTLPMYLDLVSRGCLSNVFCGKCGGADGYYDMQSNAICINENKKDKWRQILTHEMQHAYDLCDKDCYNSCLECIKAEAKAQFCSGHNSFNEAKAWGSCTAKDNLKCNSKTPVCNRSNDNGLLIHGRKYFNSLDKEDCIHNIPFPPIGPIPE